MSGHSEIELKFLVPRNARAAMHAEMMRKPASLDRRTLSAVYLDTPDRRLANAGIAWRLRREGRRWVQTLKAGGANAIERFEHEVIRPGPIQDPAAHAGTAVGEKLARILRGADKDGLDVGIRFKTEVRRIARRIRTRGAVVEVAFDEGSLLANDARLRIREVEFELVTGSATALLALAERWRKRFGLIYDPRSKAARGDRLAEGSPFPPLRKAADPRYPSDGGVLEAFGKVLDECLAHIASNAIGVLEGDEKLRVEHVHQLRVGIRRLRSALRSFRGWVPSPPEHLVEELKQLFAELGKARDSDVLATGVAADLAKANAPSLTLPPGGARPDPIAVVGAAAAQQLLLAWVAWRVGLAEAASAGNPQADPAADAVVADGAPPAAGGGNAVTEASLGAGEAGSVDGLQVQLPGTGTMGMRDAPGMIGQAEPGPGEEGGKAFPRKAQRRLGKWHRRIVAAWKAFDELEEDDLHSLRKHIKRQRYAVEFFAPVLRRRDVERYLEPLESLQDRMGEMNDLFVARARYQALLDSDPAAWFALGWLAARVDEVQRMAKRALKRLAKTAPPGR